MSPAAKKIRRKDLRQPDEFFTVTGEALDWMEAHTRQLVIAAGIVVALFLIGGGIRWWVDATEARASRDFYAAAELFNRQQWDAARDSFKSIASNLSRTSYGHLAVLYAGHASLRGGHADEAAASYRAYLAGGPPSDAMAQLAHLNLARALQATGDADGARKELDQALALEGPGRSDAAFELARSTEAAGDKQKAIELYQKFLSDYPDASERELARAQLIALGGKAPAEPAMAGGPNPLQFLPMGEAPP